MEGRGKKNRKESGAEQQSRINLQRSPQESEFAWSASQADDTDGIVCFRCFFFFASSFLLLKKELKLLRGGGGGGGVVGEFMQQAAPAA